MKKKIAPVLLLTVLFLSGIWSLISILSIQGNARVINYAGVVRGATQQLIKEELHGDANDVLMNRIDGIIDELMTGEGDNRLNRMDDQKFMAIMADYKDSWLVVKTEIQKVRQGGEDETLYQLSEELFKKADLAVSAAEEYTEKQILNTVKVFIALLIMIAVGSCLFIISEIRHRRRLNIVETAETDNRNKKEQLEKMAEALRASLNDLSELMYVADLNNYDLLFLNEAGLRNFGVDSYEGEKCYKVLRGRDTPCENCKAHNAPDHETFTWEDTNPVTGRHYMLKDRDILWEGRPARLEIAFDITKAEEEKQDLKYTLQMEDMIMECVRTLYQGPRFTETIPEILEKLGRFLGAERSYIFLVHDDLVYNDFEWCKEGITPQKHNLQALPFSIFDSWMPRFNRRECVLITDLELLKDSSPEEYEILSKQDVSSLVAAPLERDGVFCGCLGVDNPPKDRLSNISTMLKTLCYFLMLSIRRNQDEEQLAMLSYHDTLTSFYNRNRYMKDSEILQDTGIPVGIIYLDVNGLKDVNDKRGHAYGDKLLKEAARRMREVFNQQADYYRIGGDEFVILCRNMEKRTFQSHVEELKKRFLANSGCAAAIGSMWSARIQDLNELTIQADALMYEDKKEFYRKNPATKRYRHENDELLELSNPNILESEINQNHFIVYMQPKVSAGDRAAIGAEALIRYHPKAGEMVLPDSFLPMLEESQSVSQIDFFVFESVCARIKKWLDMGKEAFPVSINFSERTLTQPLFLEQLCSICDKYGIPPRLLEVEITENLHKYQDYDLPELVRQLREAGFIVALANFDNDPGNQKLLSLTDFDVLKLDKGMVTDLMRISRARESVEEIVETCQEKGICLVAEGIETEEQMEELCNCGVKLLQGFLFSRPISMDEYEEKYLLQQP